MLPFWINVAGFSVRSDVRVPAIWLQIRRKAGLEVKFEYSEVCFSLEVLIEEE